MNVQPSAGNDPVQSATAYLDTYCGFGPYAFSQVPGFDMPLYAYCMNTSFHVSELSTADQNYPIQRHSNVNDFSTTKNIVLTLRSISTVGKYDYNFDYNFYLDGTIETVVRASGYIQSASTPTTPNMPIRFTTLFPVRCTTSSSRSRLF
ncbi:uncharacterized protein IAS62_002673 [Cryptococcus decagattii]|uniref:Amine oxidase n=1 Tax=Cryptococcus decagattii TaxID=1859122 RepID=A0ABZ2AS64_9TREE